MKRIVFERQYFRQSFMDEILLTEKLATLRYEYASWIFSTKTLYSEVLSDQRERCLIFVPVIGAISSSKDGGEFTQYYLILSTKGIYMIKRMECKFCQMR